MLTSEQQTTTEEKDEADKVNELPSIEVPNLNLDISSNNLDSGAEQKEKIDHRENIVELFGGQKEEWSAYGSTEENIATQHTDGKFYFSTDAEKRFPLEKSVGDVEKFSDENGDWVMCYEPGPEGSIALYVYSRTVEKEPDEEQKNLDLEIKVDDQQQHQDKITPVLDQLIYEAPAAQIDLDYSPLMAAAETFSVEEPAVTEFVPTQNQILQESSFQESSFVEPPSEFKNLRPDKIQSKKTEIAAPDYSSVIQKPIFVESTAAQAGLEADINQVTNLKKEDPVVIKNVVITTPENSGTAKLDQLFKPEVRDLENHDYDMAVVAINQPREALSVLTHILEPSNRTVITRIHEHPLKALLEATTYAKEVREAPTPNLLQNSQVKAAKNIPHKAVNVELNQTERETAPETPKPQDHMSPGPASHSKPAAAKIQAGVNTLNNLKVFLEIAKFFPEKDPRPLPETTPIISAAQTQSVKAVKLQVAKPTKVISIERTAFIHDQDRPDVGPVIPSQNPAIGTTPKTVKTDKLHIVKPSKTASIDRLIIIDGQDRPDMDSTMPVNTPTVSTPLHVNPQTIKRGSIQNAKLPINISQGPQHPEQNPSAKPTELQQDEVKHEQNTHTINTFIQKATTVLDPIPFRPEPSLKKEADIKESNIIDKPILNEQTFLPTLSRIPAIQASEPKVSAPGNTAIKLAAPVIRQAAGKNSENQSSNPGISIQADDDDQTQIANASQSSLKLAA